MRVLNVVVADPDRKQRLESVKRIRKSRDLKIIGEAKDGLEAYTIARLKLASVVLLEVGMPRMDSFEVIRQIKAHCPGMRVVIWTSHDAGTYRALANLSGADGFVLKSCTDEELLEALYGKTARQFRTEASYLYETSRSNLIAREIQKDHEHTDEQVWKTRQ